MFRWLALIPGVVILLGACTGNKPAPQGNRSPVPVVKQANTVSGNPLRTELQRFSKDPLFRHASVSYCFTDAAGDSVIAGLNEELSLVPASTMKLFTTAAALEILGPGTRFRTTLQYEGNITGRTLHGNIILKGGGDPTFCLTEQSAQNLFKGWSTIVKKLGIDSVDGSVVGDGRIFDEDYIPYTWTWGELNMGYCAAASGLSMNGNVYQLFFDPLKEKRFMSGPRRVTPYIPEQVYENRLTENEADEEDIFLTGYPLTNRKTIRGTFPKGQTEISLVAAITNPALSAASEFLNSLRINGIYVSGNALSAADSDSLADHLKTARITDITSVQSATVASIVNITNQASYNFFAESLLKHIGLKMSGHGGTETGTRAVSRYWESKGMETGGFAMFDGSGISRFNTVTARQMTWLLSHMRKSPVSGEFFESLSVAGVSGTLRTMCVNTEAEGNIQAKSGTMSRVKSYAGYAETRSGRTLIFAIIVNNFDGPSVEVRKKIAVIMDAMVKL
jgi:serine-type D-Ala-D-Ala carboxypeptidase/endopeptidase (penicillin-binding protein 4)